MAGLKLNDFMKTKTILIAALAVIVGGAVWLFAQTGASSSGKILYYTCPMPPSVRSSEPGSCPYCGMELQAVYASDAVTNSTTTNAPSGVTNGATVGEAKPKPYPFDTCIVDGMKLGSMGDPYVFVYQGQEIKFCCASCKPVFLKDPDQYLKKIQEAAK